MGEQETYIKLGNSRKTVALRVFTSRINDFSSWYLTDRKRVLYAFPNCHQLQVILHIFAFHSSVVAKSPATDDKIASVVAVYRGIKLIELI